MSAAPKRQEKKKEEPMATQKRAVRNSPSATEAEVDRWLFGCLARRILAGGLTWVQVDARWQATRDVLGGCDPGVVASLDDDALRELMRTPGILRSGQKLRAVVANAQAFVEIAAEHGSFTGWLSSLRSLEWEDRVVALSGRLTAVRERRAWRFLNEVGEPVPTTPPWLDPASEQALDFGQLQGTRSLVTKAASRSEADLGESVPGAREATALTGGVGS